MSPVDYVYISDDGRREGLGLVFPFCIGASAIIFDIIFLAMAVGWPSAPLALGDGTVHSDRTHAAKWDTVFFYVAN